MAKSVIISCAITGGIHTPTMSQYLPVTPSEISDGAIGAAEEGAAIIHLHARDPDTGKPDPSPDSFMRFLPTIKQRCSAVLNISTGGGLGMTRAERIQAASRVSPEMASLNMGSMNFGLFPLLGKFDRWNHDWEPQYLEMTRDFIFRNTFKDIEYIVKELGQGGTRFEYECYDLGHLYNLAWVVDQGWVEPPFFVQMVLGILGGAAAEAENLAHMHAVADRLFGGDYEWSVLGAGRQQMKMASQAAMLGGNLRVGLEDSLYIGPGQRAKTNAEQVAKIKRIVEELGLRTATPDEARNRLGLKGGDAVKF